MKRRPLYSTPHLKRRAHHRQQASGAYAPFGSRWTLRATPPGLRDAKPVETPLTAMRRGKLRKLAGQLNVNRARKVNESFAGQFYVNTRAFTLRVRLKDSVTMSRLPFRKGGK